MAPSQDEVKKGLVLAAVDAFFDSTTKDAETDAQAVRSELGIIFTDDRGPTLLGAAQGEHATAYALYVEFVMRLVDMYISDAQSNNHAGISGLLREMKGRVQYDNFLLECFNLPLVEMDYFKDLNEAIKRLRDKYNNRLSPLLTNIKIMQRLQSASPVNVPAAVYADIKALGPNVLKKEINTVRGEYFYTVAQKIATEYLLFQNKSIHVAFRKVPGYEAGSGEGAHVALALRKLRDYNQPGLGLTSASASTSGRIQLARDAKFGSSQSSTGKPIDEIVKNINALLFYPKIDEEDVIATTKKDAAKGVLRSNDPRIFCFVVARHLSIIFATFEELGKDAEIKDAIIDRFIWLKAKEWGYENMGTASSIEYNSENINKIMKEFINYKTEPVERGQEDIRSDPEIVKFIESIEIIKDLNEIKMIIVAAIKAAESYSNDFVYGGGNLEASVLEPSPLKVQSITANSEEGLFQRQGVTTTPLYNKRFQEGSETLRSEARISPSKDKSSSGQEGNTFADKKKKKWW